MKCDVYLTFEGNCEEAMLFYKEVLNGEFQVLMRYSDGPPEYLSEGAEDKIMHLTMTFGKGCELKASDAFHKPIVKGSAYHISIMADDAKHGEKLFHGLADGGKIEMPYQDVFWGGKFGSFIDKFGIQWMISSPH
ncbi:MAG: VOC family protein [Flavobacteriaceae bacterium]|nr:MAG: VOC family protein [Flavobacteriaceae bacterium]